MHLYCQFLKDLVDLSIFSKSWWPDDKTSLEDADIDLLITTIHRPSHLYQTYYLALISFLLINLTWQLIVVFIHPCILIVIIKLFIANSVLWLNILLHMKVQPRITNELIGIFCFFLTKMLMNKSFFLTLFRMGLFGAAHGWWGPKKPHSLKSITHTRILQWWNLAQLYLT